MDNKSGKHVDIITLSLLFNRYKDFIAPLLVIFVVIGVFIKINVPAIEELLKGYEEQKSIKLTLEVMQNNLNFLKGIDVSSLESQFRVATKALPIDKDFESIMIAISDASNKSGVALGGFKFMVGNLSKEEGETENPTLNLSVNLLGKVDAVDKFIGILTKTLPLSEIVKISAVTDTGAVTVNFYYKPINTTIANNNLPISQISDKGLSLINDLSLLISQTPSFDLTQLPTSTASANPFF